MIDTGYVHFITNTLFVKFAAPKMHANKQAWSTVTPLELRLLQAKMRLSEMANGYCTGT
jgi:hypothetical protein